DRVVCHSNCMQHFFAHRPPVAASQRHATFIHHSIESCIMSIEDTIKEQIASNTILLNMKGSPDQPQCGFSAQAVRCLMSCGKRFAYVDILSNPEIRATLPLIANWPTFPQLWVDGELVGGCDIITEMFENGELQTLIDNAGATAE